MDWESHGDHSIQKQNSKQMKKELKMVQSAGERKKNLKNGHGGAD